MEIALGRWSKWRWEQWGNTTYQYSVTVQLPRAPAFLLSCSPALQLYSATAPALQLARPPVPLLSCLLLCYSAQRTYYGHHPKIQNLLNINDPLPKGGLKFLPDPGIWEIYKYMIEYI